MKLGLAVSVQHPRDDHQPSRFAEHVGQARLARAAGFDSLWASQHYLSDPFSYFQPIPTLARLAGEVPGMTLGTGCLLLPLHQPVALAEELATLDVIAEGRLIVGVALGYRDVETTALGLEPRDRVARFEEGLELLERLWTGEPVTFAGSAHRVTDVRISMAPMQRPRPPLWLAANADVGVRRAARLGDAWLMNPHTTLDTLARQQALFRTARAAAGRLPARETPLIRECYLAPTTAEALREAEPWLGEKYRAYRSWEQDKALPPGESLGGAFAELARDRFLIGDTVRVREEIARYRETLGATLLIVRVQWPGLPDELASRTIRLLADAVLGRA